MVMTTMAPSKPRSWADIVKKGTPETAVEASSELPQVSNDSSNDDFGSCEHSPTPDSVVNATASALQQPELAAEQTDAPEEEQLSLPAVPAEQSASSPGSSPQQSAVAAETSPDVPPGTFSTSLIPGSRGGLQCHCRGEVLSMLSHYGWLQVFGDVDHPLATKHFGRIYVQKKDVVDGHTLKAGDCVSFYLYVDNVGLGAEACRVEAGATATGNVGKSFRADAAEFVPKMRAEAAEFVPGGLCQSPSTQGPVADMFVRMSRTFKSIPANGYVEMAGCFNSAYFDDDTSSEEGNDDNVDADKESVHDESEDSSAEVLGIVQEAHVLAASAPWKKASRSMHAEHGKVDRSSSQDSSTGMTSDSTNAGVTSDSESESKTPALVMPGFRPAPALRLPPGLEDLVPILPAFVA